MGFWAAKRVGCDDDDDDDQDDEVGFGLEAGEWESTEVGGAGQRN